MPFFLLLFWLQSGATPATRPALAQEHAQKGVQFSQKGDLKSAEEEFRKAIKLAPNDALSLAFLGIVLGREQKLEEANVYLERALKIDPEDSNTRFNLALNQFRLGHPASAKTHLERILKTKPDHKPAILLLGTVLEALEDYPRAAHLLESVVELVRQQPESITALARCYYHTNRQEKARQILDWQLERPSASDGVFLGARVAAQCGDLEGAERLLTSIRSSYPDKAKIGYEIALIQYNAKHFAKSQSTLLDLTGSGIREARIYNLLGWCYHRQNQVREAIAAMNQAIALEPSSATNYHHLAQILLEQRDYSAAYEAVQRALAVAPDAHQTYKLKGQVEAGLGGQKQALASFARAVELDVRNAESLLMLGLAQSNLRVFPQAAATFEKGIARFYGDPRFYVAYGQMLLEAGGGRDAATEARAISLLEKALAVDNSLADAHYELGKILLMKGKTQEALPHLEAAARLNPQGSRIHFSLANAYRRLDRMKESADELRLFRTLQAEEEKQPASQPAK